VNVHAPAAAILQQIPGVWLIEMRDGQPSTIWLPYPMDAHLAVLPVNLHAVRTRFESSLWSSGSVVWIEQMQLRK
jgi:hypothetical protein